MQKISVKKISGGLLLPTSFLLKKKKLDKGLEIFAI